MKQGLTMFFSGATVVLLAFATPALLGFGEFALAADANTIQAVRANDFLQSLGAGTHIIQGIDSPLSVEAGIRYLGIRNIREDGTTNRRLVGALCAIHSATGAMIDELPLGGDLADTQAQWEQLAGCGALVAAEGPNEPNNFALSYNGSQCSFNNGKGTFLPCAQFQAALY